MKTLLKLISAFIIIISIFYYFQANAHGGNRSGCEVFIYVANNSFFDCRIEIDGFPQSGYMLPNKVKVFSTEIPSDTPKRIKVKVIYESPDYLEPRSYFLVTKKLECGQTDSLYIAHTK